MDKTESFDATYSVAALVAELKSLKTQFDIFRFMRRVTESNGCRAFMVCELPSMTTLELSGNTIITNWPSELLAHFDQAGLLQSSPILQRLRASTLPFTYSMADIARQRGDTVSFDLFQRFGLTSGVYFPVHDSSGKRGCVSFCGDGVMFTVQQMVELMYLSVHVYQGLAEIRDIDVRVSDQLSEREIDCLNWTAAGKTSAEIADILELSEHTVNHYLNRATKKLDAVNRSQAVAKALRAGLIK
ncbi:DNA-binding transcriptional regulator, CsgD family [Rhizobium sp. RU35A]|uniref:LuxR family transcriptional regulator n=1 Tax=Rhizobium straminoryzae TaxID=1387186 RepID=A0A549TBQ7_9HYPH|nr:MULTISPECIES: autoinducer binding domain-containing protein [Rhizobium]TRL39288.1 LuxR family transcriptional regulator [Rhizobium straminoryzae]SIP99147.1 DNA-binding transcriptional regulator, CsgD family [Rhizobium sp. RU35A]